MALISFQAQLTSLAQVHGRHTELISVYIPTNRKKSDVIAYLRNEITESANIRDKINRKAVLGSIQHLLE